MSESALPSSTSHRASISAPGLHDPFATPASPPIPLSLPAYPQPCATHTRAQPARTSAGSSPRPSRQSDHSHTYPHPRSPTTSILGAAVGERHAAPSPSTSLPETTFSKEKGSQRSSREIAESLHGRDPEKGGSDMRHGSQRSSNSYIMTSITYAEEEDEELSAERTAQEQHATRILLFMSAPCVALSFLNAAWTLVALIVTALSQPLRFGAGKPTFAQHLTGLLRPALNLQLRCIYAAPVPATTTDAGPRYRPFPLVLVHLLSPFLSFAMMFAAWVLAVYWVSSAIVGDPAGQDKRDDGKECVLGLRTLWERWLAWSFHR